MNGCIFTSECDQLSVIEVPVSVRENEEKDIKGFYHHENHPQL